SLSRAASPCSRTARRRRPIRTPAGRRWASTAHPGSSRRSRFIWCSTIKNTGSTRTSSSLAGGPSPLICRSRTATSRVNMRRSSDGMERSSSRTSDRPTGSTSRECVSTTSASKRGTSSTSATTSSASPSNADLLEAPVASLPGAGPVTAERLRARGVVSVRDLLLRLPRGYDDLRRATSIGALPGVADGTVVLVRGSVKRLHVFPRRLLDLFVEDDGASLRARWFRVPGAMANSFPKGSAVALAARGDGGLGVRPRYGVVQGVKGRVLEKMRGAALARLGPAAPGDLLPGSSRARLGLPTLVEALARLHGPADEEALHPALLAPARRRIAIEGALVAQAAFLLRRAAAGRSALVVSPETAAAARARLVAALPFAPTTSQARALDAVAADLAGARPMRRLLVGDVGSGKTAVALGAAALVAAAGGQTLMMVPTEVLAEQQARALAPV